MGIERCASARSADRFEPAMMPVTEGKKRPKAYVRLYSAPRSHGGGDGGSSAGSEPLAADDRWRGAGTAQPAFSANFGFGGGKLAESVALLMPVMPAMAHSLASPAVAAAAPTTLLALASAAQTPLSPHAKVYSLDDDAASRPMRIAITERRTKMRKKGVMREMYLTPARTSADDAHRMSPP